MSLRIGAVGVQRVSAKLLEHGFLVSLPVFDSGYDLVSDWCGKLYRIQVKSTIGNEDQRRRKLKFLAVKGPGYGWGSTKNINKKKSIYSRNDCDTFIFYHITQDALFVMPRAKMPKTKSIYLEPNSKWRDNWAVIKD
jgi:hypothetical protein